MVTVIQCGRLFDGTGSDPVPGASLIVDGDRVVDVVPAGGRVPEGVETVDLGRHFVMPGLVDAHTHLSIIPHKGNQHAQLAEPPGRKAMRVAGNLRRDLDAATTTLRVMGEEDWLDVHARQAVGDGDMEGPRLSIATRGIAPTNGHGRGRAGFDGPDEIRRAARENLAAGADFLKVFATGGTSSESGLSFSAYSLDEFRVVVEEAERKGTYVAAHAHGGPGLLTAVEAGVRTIEHAKLATPVEIEAMLKRECWVVLNFAILFRPDGIEQGDAGNETILEKVRATRELVPDTARAVIESGLRVALGTDSMHGCLGYEVQSAIKFGMAPRDALLAVTSRAAEVLRMEGAVGTLQPGRFADIVAFAGDPLEDPGALDRVAYVMKGGRTLRGPRDA